jgi:hypothetical protein
MEHFFNRRLSSDRMQSWHPRKHIGVVHGTPSKVVSGFSSALPVRTGAGFSLAAIF